MFRKITIAVLCAAGFACASASASPVVITSASPAWIHVGSGATWVLPASIPGCGSENEPTCEPAGIFYGNVAWAGAPSYISLTDSEGISDIITFDSNGPGGHFRVMFYSDPNPNCCSVPPGYIQFADYLEDNTNGGMSGPAPICCELTGVSVNVASDGEASFHPFGVTFDTSDGIQFTGNVVAGGVPEPMTLALFGAGLAGFAGFRRRNRK